jgi:glycosyltransferase involved in cell wall biosynthesis
MGIDVFVDERQVQVGRAPDGAPPAGSWRVQSAHDFVWRARRGQYDLVVYEIGNSTLHDFIWPYLYRWPGLAVLHDARVHHARGHALLSRRNADAFRAEFAWAHPDVGADVAELAIHGFDGTYYYQWPMLRGLVESSRMVATHARGVVRELNECYPEARAEYIALGDGLRHRLSGDDRRQLRATRHFGPEHVVFGVFGGLTAEKRVPQILRALAATRRDIPAARLLLAGAPDRRLALPALIESLDLDDIVSLLPGLDDEQFDRWIGAIDVSLNLRWPSARETSGPWVLALSAGLPTVVIDLLHQVHLPVLDPRKWTSPSGDRPVDPVSVAIDILDEEHSLRLAMRRLATDEGLRGQLGRAARRYWEQEHTVARMAGDYLRVINRAASSPAPAALLPAPLRPDALDHTRALLDTFGEHLCRLR